jgi:hypothetical protein
VNCSPNSSIRSFFWLAMVVLATTVAFSHAAGAQESKPRHVITNDDISSTNSSAPAPSPLAATAASSDKDQSDANGKAVDASASDPTTAEGTMSAEEMRTHQAGGVDPNEKPKEAIKRIAREESELQAKLDRFREKAETEKSDNRRRMWLEAIDHQQVTLQQMEEERTKLQKSEDEKAQAEPSGTEPAAEGEQGEAAK